MVIPLPLGGTTNLTPHELHLLLLSISDIEVESKKGCQQYSLDGVTMAIMGTPDHRFATLFLPLNDQADLAKAAPLVFSPSNGPACRGATQIRIANAELDQIRQALDAAHRLALSVRSANGARAA